ncbi:serrate RNA effector molecule-like [Dorcoceras hygrometricum]|uniref:Serrate RNA effector molecule-like n=1 Tax=Dorcoceras hygrometricum TaxID=472368 RepID=A0A2Z7CEN0_9LAMI|nr:serrate RNA effector molecule-like [Dorcoceras hygrometricum]
MHRHLREHLGMLQTEFNKLAVVDWDPGRGGFADAFPAGGSQSSFIVPRADKDVIIVFMIAVAFSIKDVFQKLDEIAESCLFREGMMSYKQFIQELEDDILPTEAERRYQEYKSEYISTQKKAYFSAHKDEEWLKDKYHPTNLLAVIERRNELAKKLAKDFQLDLQNGTLDLGPSFNPSLNRAEQSSEPNSDDDADVGGKRRRPGRVGAKESDLMAAPKAHPISSEPRRIQVDVEQAQALVRKLDAEKGIEDNVLCRADNDRMNRDKSHSSSSGPVIIIRGLSTIKGLEGIELLDTLLTYLWRIHGLDYYGLIESNEAKGLRHVRIDGKNSDASGKDWENKLDFHWQERLKGLDPLEIMTAKEKIDVAATEALDPHVRKIRDEKYGWKYGCGAKGCTKLFHAAEFVHKHLKLKHPEVVMELTSKVREELYFQNYMDDGNAPGGTPIMQPSFPKEKPHRRRPGRREHAENPLDRSDEPSGDYPSNNDGAPGNNGDEAMFDAFGGQGIAVASFPSDIAPPVLMPVPGAGPLGPFVPAPPEVAMRMLRDHGGPSPFEGGRNGRSGPQVGGPAPIIALPPTFRQDPRRLRRINCIEMAATDGLNGLSSAMELDAFRRLFPLRFHERHLLESIRSDGRPLGRARATTVVLGAADSANGSAMAKIGCTTMLAAIKLEVMTPSMDAPDEGCIAIDFHMPPICSPLVRPGRPAELAPVLSKQLSDNILRQELYDTLLVPINIRKTIIRLTCKAAWMAYLDVYCLDADGALFDAALLSAVAALSHLQIPAVALNDNGRIVVVSDVDAGSRREKEPINRENRKLHLSTSIFSLTCIIHKNYILADPTSEEESVMETYLTVVLDSSFQLVSLNKPGGPGLTNESAIQDCIRLTRQRVTELQQILNEAVSDLEVD